MKTVKKTRLFTIVMAIVFTVSTIFAVMMTAFAANQNKIVTKTLDGRKTIVRYCDLDFISVNPKDPKKIELKQFIWLHENADIQWLDAEYQLIFDKKIASHVKNVSTSSRAESYDKKVSYKTDRTLKMKEDGKTWSTMVSPFAKGVDKKDKGFFFTGLIGVKQVVIIEVELDKPYADLEKQDYAIKSQVVNTKEKEVFDIKEKDGHKAKYPKNAIFDATESATYIPASNSKQAKPEYNDAKWLKASGMKVTYFPNGINEATIKDFQGFTGNHILEADYKTTNPTLLMDGQFVPEVGYLVGVGKKYKPLDMSISIPKELAPYITKVTLFGDRGARKDSKKDITKEIKKDGKYVLEDFMDVWDSSQKLGQKANPNFENTAGAPTEYRVQIEFNQDITGLPFFNKNFLTTDVQMTSRCGQTVVPFGYQNAIIEFGYFDEEEPKVVPPVTPDKPNENIPDDKTPQAPAPKEEIKDLGTPLGAAPKTSIVGTSIILSAIVSLTSGTAMVGSIRKKND